MSFYDILARTGMDVFIDTDTHTGTWKALITIGETTINAITITTITGERASTVPTATAIAGGTLITFGGTCTSIELTSGGVTMIREA